MKNIIKKIIPKVFFNFYYFFLAELGAFIYGYPSKKIIVIGITGTKGKTSTSNFLWSALNSAQIKTGIISTANIRIGNKEKINDFHMTMPGRFVIQKYLREIVKEGCEVAIVEVTSQGILQYRHKGIDFDVAIFTNLTPEHIDAHGSFENYKKTKGKFFECLSKSKHKKFRGKAFPKIIVTNADSSEEEYFKKFNADQKYSFGIKNNASYKANDVKTENGVVSFDVDSKIYELSLPGVFNIYNALPAVSLAKSFGISYEDVFCGLKKISNIPGRMEEINAGQNFKVFVDYAHEKASMTACVETARSLALNNKIIILLGAEGGGRDKGKRSAMGEVVGKYADHVVVSNVDPYDDDPMPIAEDIAVVAEKHGKKRNENLFVILDRRQGINKALSLANEGDVVMITGKGAEQSMIIGNQTIDWDDRKVVREELLKING